MLLKELYKYYGTWTHMVRTLNLGNSTYQIWRKQGYIPFKTQLWIENKTNGQFKAEEAHGRPAVKKKKSSDIKQKQKFDNTNSA